MEDKSSSLFDRMFAVTIAFVIPGLVALVGVATVNATVRSWFAGAANGPTFAGLFFVLAAAVALSIVITSLRWYLFEHLHVPGRGCALVGDGPALDLAKRERLEVAYRDMRHQYYYWYLASANTAVAIPLAVVAWLFTSPSILAAVGVVVAAAAASYVLGLAGCNAVTRFDERATTVLGRTAA